MPIRVKHKVHVGSDGSIMSAWQIWLWRLCLVALVWGVLEAALGIATLLGVPLLDSLISDRNNVDMFVRQIGASTIVGGIFNTIGACLGFVGAKDPKKITLFFWVSLANGVLCGWELASNISVGAIDPASAVSCLFVIALAVCAWNVRGQTGYFDEVAHGNLPAQPENEYDEA